MLVKKCALFLFLTPPDVSRFIVINKYRSETAVLVYTNACLTLKFAFSPSSAAIIKTVTSDRE